MRKILILVVAFSLSCASIGYSQGVPGLPLPDLQSLSQNLKVNPYVQVGFQRAGSNMSLPIGAEIVQPPDSLQIDTMDIALRDANFWVGTLGVNVTVTKMLSLFASAGGNLPRSIVVTGQIPVSLNGVGTSSNIEFTGSKVEAWYAQAGVGLGPILLGLYRDHFGLFVDDPRQGSQPLANQTLRGDVLSKTFAPYIGLAIPAGQGLATVTYTPFAWSNTTLVLRNSSSAASVSQLQYKWNKPGVMVTASLQYNTPVTEVASFGLWGNYTWLDMRGNATLEFENPTVFREKNVTATLTKFILQGGVMLSINF